MGRLFIVANKRELFYFKVKFKIIFDTPTPSLNM